MVSVATQAPVARVGLAAGGADTREARAGEARVRLEVAMGPPRAGGALVAPLLGDVVVRTGGAVLVILGGRAGAGAEGRHGLGAGHAGAEGGVVERALCSDGGGN